MLRKIFSWLLIILSAVLIIASLAGIGAIWYYKEPITTQTLDQLTQVDNELKLAETTIQDVESELDNALLVLNSTEQALNQFTQNDPQAFFENVQTTLDDELLPELKLARTRLITARDSLKDMQGLLDTLRYIPFLNISISDETVTDLIDSADGLEGEIAGVSELAGQASGFLEDAAFFAEMDFGGMRQDLEGFRDTANVYGEKISGWRSQLSAVKEAVPVWSDRLAIGLTIFLLWFGISQFGLLLHGRAILKGENPLELLQSY